MVKIKDIFAITFMAGTVAVLAYGDAHAKMAAQSYVDTKEAIANKSTDITADANSDVKYPSVKATKTYVDNAMGDVDMSAKQDKLTAGTSGVTIPTIGAASAPGTSLTKVTSINATVASRTDNNVPTEKAIGTYVDTKLSAKANMGDLGTAAYTNSAAYATAAQGAKADSAVQTESDPTISAWAKSVTKPMYTPAEVGAIPESQKGAVSGVATLDATSKVPVAQIPTGTTSTTVALGNHNHDGTYATAAQGTKADNAIPTAQKGAASGVATLDATSKVPVAQIPTGTTSTTVALGNHNHDGTYATAAQGAKADTAVQTVSKTGTGTFITGVTKSGTDLVYTTGDAPTAPTKMDLTKTATGTVGTLTVLTGDSTATDAMKQKTLTAGSNVTITPAAGTITISATDTNTTNVAAATSGTGYVVTGITASGDTVTATKANVQIPVGSATATTYATIWVQN